MWPELAVVVPEERAVGVRQARPVPFLEVVTRTFGGRPEGLARCRASLECLQSKDWTQTLVVDRARAGVAKANRALAEHDAGGRWVWVLDDDDVCTAPMLVDWLERVAEREQPDVIVVQVRWLGRLLPPEGMWRARPQMGAITSPSVVVRGDVWDAYRSGWREVYEGDYWFIDGLWQAGLRWSWLPLLAAQVDRANHGAAEG